MLRKDEANDESPAEFRGPGVRHNFDDSGDDYDIEMDSRSRGAGSGSSRIILLGDGREVLTADGDEAEMLDQDDEDKDNEGEKGLLTGHDERRGTREETPGPEPQTSTSNAGAHEGPSSTDTPMTDPDGSNESEAEPPKSKAIPETVLPDKLVTPLTDEKK